MATDSKRPEYTAALRGLSLNLSNIVALQAALDHTKSLATEVGADFTKDLQSEGGRLLYTAVNLYKETGENQILDAIKLLCAQGVSPDAERIGSPAIKTAVIGCAVTGHERAIELVKTLKECGAKTKPAETYIKMVAGAIGAAFEGIWEALRGDVSSADVTPVGTPTAGRRGR